MTYAIWTAAATLLAVLRVVGVKAQWYQAAAHLYVGALLGLALADYDGDRWFYVATVGWLSVVEVAMFIVQRRKPGPQQRAPLMLDGIWSDGRPH